MATLHVCERNIEISPHQLGAGSIAFNKQDIKLMLLCNTHQLSTLLMTGIFPLRIAAGVLWGTTKEAAEQDRQRRLKEAGR